MKYFEVLNQLQQLNRPSVIMISGFGGSGKSTFAGRLSKDLNASVIGIDDFCKDVNMTAYEYWNLMDFDRFKKEVLQAVHFGRDKISYGALDWETNAITKDIEVNVCGHIIVEGIGLFRPDLMTYYDCSIWIECPLDIAISRGKKRDKDVYGVDNDMLWDGIWRDNELQCYEAYKPIENADYLINYET